MTVSLQTLIDRSIKNMGSGINPQVKEYAIELVRRAYVIGIYVQITSGYRSNAEQTKLYNQGRTTKGNIVTNAKAGQSIHNYGLAIDYVLVSEDGKTAYWDINRNMNGNQIKDWLEVANIGKSMGFQWGGDWKSFPDYPHLDMQKGLSLSQLAAGKRPHIPSLMPKDWLEVGDTGTAVKELQEDLNTIGIKVTVDGIYGEGVKEAVMLFQQRTGLLKDGKYGSASKQKMKVLVERTYTAKPATSKPIEPKEEITLADILKLSTNEGKNAQLRVLKRFEKKEPALSKQWREKVEKGEFTYDDFAEVFFVAVDRGYITGLVNTDALYEKVEALEKATSEK